MGSREDPTTYYMVTGSNNGLGLGTCKRILTTFLTTRPATHRIHLVASTRSKSKSGATLARLHAHLRSNASLKAAAEARCTLSAVEMDLTILRSVLDAATRLQAELPRLDVLVCNAGIAGPIITNMFQAVVSGIRHPVATVTWPRFVTELIAPRTPSQLPPTTSPELRAREPVLGEVFAANTFGHFCLVHELRQLMSHPKDGLRGSPGRVVWVGTHDTDGSFFSLDDLQSLHSRAAYRGSKRLTDMLFFAMTTSEARPAVQKFADPIAVPDIPRWFLCHPGVTNTNIHPQNPILDMIKVATFYLARWLGSPWHAIDTATGSNPAVWLATAPLSSLEALEERDGRGKWGASTDRWGKERILRSEVEGWGYDGHVGHEEKWAKNRFGRAAWSVDLTERQRLKFLEEGGQAWNEMEKLREEWMALLAEAAQEQATNQQKKSKRKGK